MKKILRLHPNRIRKSDFNTLYNVVIQIADKYTPGQLHINETLAAMKAGVAQADELIVAELGSPLTKTLSELRTKRNRLVSSIVMRAKSELTSDNAVQSAASETVFSVANRILCNFSRKSFDTQFALVKQFVDEVEGNDALKQAVGTVGASDSFARLSELQASIDALYGNRREAVSTRKRMETGKAKRDLYGLMSNLFAAIEGAALEYSALDYSPLVDELNKEIGKHRALVAARQTRSANLTKASVAQTAATSQAE